jgi:hypothetical protein
MNVLVSKPDCPQCRGTGRGQTRALLCHCVRAVSLAELFNPSTPRPGEQDELTRLGFSERMASAFPPKKDPP